MTLDHEVLVLNLTHILRIHSVTTFSGVLSIIMDNNQKYRDYHYEKNNHPPIIKIVMGYWCFLLFNDLNRGLETDRPITCTNF